MPRIVAAYTSFGVPQTGLSVVIDIWRVDTGAAVVVGGGMTHFGGGMYQYDFTGFDEILDYGFRCDGGAGLVDADRYKFGGNEVPIADDDSASVRVTAAGLESDAVAEIQAGLVAGMEYQRGTHTAEVYLYVDPVTGNDSNDGSSPSSAKLTIGAAVAAVAQEHTAIIVLDGATGQQVFNENITLSTRFTFLRGPGLDIQLKGASGASPTISITADGCEVSGFEITTLTTGNPDGIVVSANFARLTRLRVVNCKNIGVDCTGDRLRVTECIIEGSGAEGLQLAGDSAIIGEKTLITGSTNDGIEIVSGDANVIDDVMVTGNGGRGINIQSGVGNRLTRVSMSGNALGDVRDFGTETVRFDTVLDRYDGVLYFDSVSGVSGKSYPVGTRDVPSNDPGHLKVIADGANIAEFMVSGTLTLAEAHPDWTFVGVEEGAEVALGGQSVGGSVFRGVTVSGVGTGVVRAIDCVLSGVSGVRMIAATSRVVDVTLVSGESRFDRCSGGIVDLGGVGSVVVSQWSGDLDLRGVALGAVLDFASGSLTLASTVTAGTITVRGIVGPVVDNSVGGTLVVLGRGALQPELERVQGLSGHNQVIAVLTKDANNNVLTQRLRVYDTLANAGVDDGATGLLDTYLITATYDVADVLATYSMVRVGS